MTKSQTTTSTDIRKTIEATINSFLSSYEDGREQGNTSLINRDVTADCTRQLLPVSLCKTLGAPETFLMPNDMYEQLYIDDLIIGGVYNTVNEHMSIDTEARMAAVNSTSDFKFKDGALPYRIRTKHSANKIPQGFYIQLRRAGFNQCAPFDVLHLDAKTDMSLMLVGIDPVAMIPLQQGKSLA